MWSRLITLAVIIVMAFPSATLAQSSSQEGYSNESERIQNQVNQASDGGLPMTGLDVILLAAVGLALIATGVALHFWFFPRTDQ